MTRIERRPSFRRMRPPPAGDCLLAHWREGPHEGFRRHRRVAQAARHHHVFRSEQSHFLQHFGRGGRHAPDILPHGKCRRRDGRRLFADHQPDQRPCRAKWTRSDAGDRPHVGSDDSVRPHAGAGAGGAGIAAGSQRLSGDRSFRPVRWRLQMDETDRRSRPGRRLCRSGDNGRQFRSPWPGCTAVAA